MQADEKNQLEQPGGNVCVVKCFYMFNKIRTVMRE